MQENSTPEMRQEPGGWLPGVVLGAVGLLVLGAKAPRVAGLLLSSAIVAIPAAVFALFAGTSIALLAAKTTAPGRGVALGLLGSLVLLPLYVIASAWMAALGDQGGAPSLLAGGGSVGGWLVGYPGAIFLHAVAATPWAVLLATAALRRIDRRLEEAALIDTSPVQVLLTVTLRQAAPALAAIGVLLAVLAAAEMTMTDLLQVRTFAEEVYTQAAAGELLDPTASGTWRLALGVVTLGLFAAAAIATLMQRLAYDQIDQRQSPWRWRPQRPRRVSAGLALAVGVLLLLPVVALAYRAGVVFTPNEAGEVQTRWSSAKLVSSVAAAPWQHRRELIVSTSLAVCVATAATFVGGLVAWWMRRQGRAATFVCFVLAMLLAIPGPVIGLLVIRGLNQPLDSPLAWLGDLYGTWFAPWLAQMVRITPAVALLLWPAALGTPQRLVEAAQLDGAGPLSRVRWIVWPLMAPALAAAWLVAFALSLGELSATVLVVPPGTPPLSVRMLSLLHYGVEDRVAAICLVLIAGYVVAAAAVARLLPFASRGE